MQQSYYTSLRNYGVNLCRVADGMEGWMDRLGYVWCVSSFLEYAELLSPLGPTGELLLNFGEAGACSGVDDGVDAGG